MSLNRSKSDSDLLIKSNDLSERESDSLATNESEYEPSDELIEIEDEPSPLLKSSSELFKDKPDATQNEPAMAIILEDNLFSDQQPTPQQLANELQKKQTLKDAENYLLNCGFDYTQDSAVATVLINKIKKFNLEAANSDQIQMHVLAKKIVDDLDSVKRNSLDKERRALILNTLSCTYRLCENPEDANATEMMGKIYKKVEFDPVLGGKSLPLIITGIFLLAVGIAALAVFAPMALAATDVIGAATLAKAGIIGAGITTALKFMGASAAICSITSAAVGAVSTAIGSILTFLEFKENGFAKSQHSMFSETKKYQEQINQNEFDWKSTIYQQ